MASTSWDGSPGRPSEPVTSPTRPPGGRRSAPTPSRTVTTSPSRASCVTAGPRTGLPEQARNRCAAGRSPALGRDTTRSRRTGLHATQHVSRLWRYRTTARRTLRPLWTRPASRADEPPAVTQRSPASDGPARAHCAAGNEASPPSLGSYVGTKSRKPSRCTLMQRNPPAHIAKARWRPSSTPRPPTGASSSHGARRHVPASQQLAARASRTHPGPAFQRTRAAHRARSHTLGSPLGPPCPAAQAAAQPARPSSTPTRGWSAPSLSYRSLLTRTRALSNAVCCPRMRPFTPLDATLQDRRPGGERRGSRSRLRQPCRRVRQHLARIRSPRYVLRRRFFRESEATNSRVTAAPLVARRNETLAPALSPVRGRMRHTVDAPTALKVYPDARSGNPHLREGPHGECAYSPPAEVHPRRSPPLQSRSRLLQAAIPRHCTALEVMPAGHLARPPPPYDGLLPRQPRLTLAAHTIAIYLDRLAHVTSLGSSSRHRAAETEGDLLARVPGVGHQPGGLCPRRASSQVTRRRPRAEPSGASLPRPMPARSRPDSAPLLAGGRGSEASSTYMRRPLGRLGRPGRALRLAGNLPDVRRLPP
jgi:hypothetical protein